MHEPRDYFRSIKMLAVGALPALVAFVLARTGRSFGRPELYAAAFVVFGYLTPIVTANTKRKGSVVVAILLAALFLGMGFEMDFAKQRLAVVPWWLFSWGLYPGIAISLSIRALPPRALSVWLPLALGVAVAVRVFLPDKILIPASIALLLVDLAILAKYPKTRLVRQSAGITLGTPAPLEDEPIADAAPAAAPADPSDARPLDATGAGNGDPVPPPPAGQDVSVPEHPASTEPKKDPS
ncbi:MAG: hypothetical protein RLZZ324_759 [Candidatus Parcubacteria bacterium]|jgi:hypothetical protein